MCTRDKAKNVLVEAQTSLRELMEAAIRQHRYGEVAEIAGMAEGLSRLLIGSNGTAPAPSGSPSSPAPDPAPPPAKVARSRPAPNRRPAGEAKAKSRTKPKGKPEYPHFVRDGDRLVKVGWSKKHKDEYEHRATRETVIAVGRHIASRVKSGQVFEVDSLNPVPDSAGGEVPAYQVYLVLAWLRSVGAVERKGRDGQILRDSSIGSGGLDKFWESVPARAD